MVEVRTRDEAIAVVDHALQAWSGELTGLLLQAQHAAAAAEAHVDDVLRQRGNEVAAIEAAITAAPDEARAELQGRLTRAREAQDGARRAAVRVADISAAVAQLVRGQVTITGQVDAARSKLAGMSVALESYRGSGGSFATGGAPLPSSIGGSSRARAEANQFAAFGLVDITVSTAGDDGNPILDDDPARGTFGKGGLSRADYRWAVQTWNDTVGPGVAGGKTRDYFAERDGRAGAQPLRRTADVYDMFLGGDRIRADRRPDGSLNVTNGRHRLFIAQELQIKSLPGELS